MTPDDQSAFTPSDVLAAVERFANQRTPTFADPEVQAQIAAQAVSGRAFDAALADAMTGCNADFTPADYLSRAQREWAAFCAEAGERAVASMATRLLTPADQIGELRQRLRTLASNLYQTTGMSVSEAIERAASDIIECEERRFKDAIFDAVYDLAPAAVMVENFATLSSPPPPRKRAGGYTRGLVRRIRRS